MAAWGVVKSMTTSNPATNGGVNADASAFSFASSTFTLWPRSAATSATSLPVLPIPKTSTRMVCAFLSMTLQLNSVRNVEHRLIGVRKEVLVQASHCLLNIFLVDHEAHVDLAGALRDHPHIYMADRTEDLPCDAVMTTNVLAHQADQRFVALHLHIGDLGQLRADLGQLLVAVDAYRDAHFAGRYHIDH